MNKLCLTNFHTSLVAFSRALNQIVWWNFMYIQQQFIETFIRLWRHPFNCFKCFWEGTFAPELPSGSQVHYGGPDGPIAWSAFCCCKHCSCSSSLGLLIETEIIKIFKAHYPSLGWFKSLLTCILFLLQAQWFITPFPILWGKIRANNGNFERYLTFCWTQKIISFKCKGSLLILRPHSHPHLLHVDYINEITTVAYKGHRASVQTAPKAQENKNTSYMSSVELL